MTDYRHPFNESDFIGKRGEARFQVLITQEHAQHGPWFEFPRHFGDKTPVVDYFVESAAEEAVRPFCLMQVKSTRAGYTESGRLKVSVSAKEMERLARYGVPTYVVGIDERGNRGFILSANGESIAGFSGMCTDHPLTLRTLAKLHREVAGYWNAIPPMFESTFVDERWRERDS